MRSRIACPDRVVAGGGTPHSLAWDRADQPARFTRTRPSLGQTSGTQQDNDVEDRAGEPANVIRCIVGYNVPMRGSQSTGLKWRQQT